ncbi:MAG: hypothetical protein AB7K35_10795 [Pseudorhodoplanes sp.]
MLIVLCDPHLRKESGPSADDIDPEIRIAIAQALKRVADALGKTHPTNGVSKYPEPTGDELLAYVAWSGDGGRNCD